MPAKSKGRSRNSTPMSAGSSHDPQQPSSAASESNARLSYDDILDSFCKGQSPPPSSTLRKIADALRICSDVAKTNVDRYDRGMRDSSQRKKLHLDDFRRSQHAERQAEEERRERLKHQKAKKEEEDESRPLAIGAHSLAPQDGSAPTAGMLSSAQRPPEQLADSPLADRYSVPTPQESPPHQPPEHPVPSPANSVTSEEPERPPPAVPAYETFGKDPSTFDDPTIYDLRPFTDETDEYVKKEILGVAHYPDDDLHDLTCGTPPDRDFSNAKPANQVSAQHFLNAIEPYIRPMNPEDTAFLEERGDRVTPFEMPRRGKRSYKEIWAEEDGTHAPSDTKHQAPLGDADDAGDEILPQPGPLLARLLGATRSERRDTGNSQANGADGEREETAEPITQTNGDAPPLSPSNRLTDFSGGSSHKYGALGRPEPQASDDRLKEELRHLGFLSDDAEPDFEAHYDDEIAARLRYLQEQLEHQSVLNGARKARVLELADERMAQQEWSTIADDLDSQLNQAYLKRHRNIGKGKKQLKRPGGPGGGSHLIPGQALPAGTGRSGIGEPIKSLMGRRTEWRDTIGPVVDYGRINIPQETIFDTETIKRLVSREKELWTEQQET